MGGGGQKEQLLLHMSIWVSRGPIIAHLERWAMRVPSTGVARGKPMVIVQCMLPIRKWGGDLRRFRVNIW